MELADILIKLPELFLDDTVDQALQMMETYDVDFVPVLNSEKTFYGVVTIRDLLSAVHFPKNCLSEFVRIPIATYSVNTPIDTLPDHVLEVVLLDENGYVEGIVPIQARAKALKRNLVKSLDQLNAIVNAAQNGIFAIDQQGIIFYANKIAKNILKNELIGSHVLQFIPDTIMLNILDTGETIFGHKLLVGKIPVLFNCSPIKTNGFVTGVVSVFQDLSSVEKAYLEMDFCKKLNYELEAIINSSYDGMFIADGEGRVLRVNQAYERITGIQAESVVGKTMTELIEAGLYDQSVTLKVIESQSTTTINQVIKGTEKEVLATGSPIYDQQGHLFRVVTNVRDITDLNKLQKRLLKSSEQTKKFEAELSLLRAMQLEQAEMIYCSKEMNDVVEMVLRVADVDSTVLITGESGTGKELIAKLIHKKGKGLDKPFIKINCGAIPAQLLESELFGYVGGAFTGAKKEGKPGLFELANKGTLFLDEIGDMPLVLQVKLLRAIQEREIYRLGDTKPIQIDVRIVAATHRDLYGMVKEGNFREDLYYRLMVVPIHLPPLRERKEDIPLLLTTFLERFNHQFNFNKKFSTQVVDKLTQYAWPGNIREMQNLIERMVVISSDDILKLDCLPEGMVKKSVYMPIKSSKLKDAVAEIEARMIQDAYSRLGSWQNVALELGVDRTTIFRKAIRYGIASK